MEGVGGVVPASSIVLAGLTARAASEARARLSGARQAAQLARPSPRAPDARPLPAAGCRAALGVPSDCLLASFKFLLPAGGGHPGGQGGGVAGCLGVEYRRPGNSFRRPGNSLDSRRIDGHPLGRP